MPSVASLSRGAAHALVEREYRATGSKMAAYHNVGSLVGTSAEWIRGYVKGYGAKTPDVDLGFKLIAAFRSGYNKTCERVEQAAAREKALREEIDAALESVGLMVDREETTKTTST